VGAFLPGAVPGGKSSPEKVLYVIQITFAPPILVSIMRPSYRELERENRELKREIKELRAQLKEAQARIAALEAELRRGRRQAAPFSRDEKKAEPKRPGRRPGQGRFSYLKPPPEEEIR